MMKRIVIALFVVSPALASGPYYQQKDPNLQQEFENVYNDIRTVPSGIYKTSSMTIQGITVDSLTVNSQAQLKGTGTNDSAAAGYVGEYISSTTLFASAVSASASLQFWDVARILLTAGDWDITGCADMILNGSATPVYIDMGVGNTAGNNVGDMVYGDNLIQINPNASNSTNTGVCVANVRRSLSGNATYYLKCAMQYASGGPPKCYGRISARRVR